MKISIDNFKTLKSLEEFEFRPFTLITGVNSSGKSSLIQFLLLIKQTLEKPATNAALNLDGDILELGIFEDIIYQKNTQNCLIIIIEIDDIEYPFPNYEPLKIKSCQVRVYIKYSGERIVVDTVEFNYYIPDTIKKDQFLRFKLDGDNYSMTANTGLFNNDFFILPALEEKDRLKGNILFSSFFPQLFTTQIKNPDYGKSENGDEKQSTSEFEKLLEQTKAEPYKQYSIEPNTKLIQEFITRWFERISYIGPLREEPSEFYSSNKSGSYIGVKGEYAAFILEKEADNIVTYQKMEMDSDGLISFSTQQEKLLVAVNHWICDIFKLAKRIYSIEVQDRYQVRVENNYGVESTIKHVGFGVSQLLPIIVEGLRMSKNSMLILEQPEIHLHPKIQGQLFDFFYSLITIGKTVLIETHSDHLLVRMRRRIAEDSKDELLSLISLKFVETGETSHYFENIELTDLGGIQRFPKDFIEQQEDYRAIVKAQARRKLK